MSRAGNGWIRRAMPLCAVLAVASAMAAGPPPARAANGLEPKLDCLDYDAGQNLLTAHWGYVNINGVPLSPAPSDNYFDPPPFYRGQPTEFQPGSYTDVFTTTFSADTELTWHLFGSAVTASNDPRYYCDDGPDLTPADTAILDGPRGTTASRSATFQLFSEAGATFECSLDDAAFDDCGTPLELSGLADGDHRLLVRASDSRGNVDPTPAQRTWSVDGTAPAAPAIAGAGGIADRDGSFNVRGFAEPGSTVRLYEGAERIDTSETDPSTGAWTVGVIDASEGTHSYRARATDAAGNLSPYSAPGAVVVDSTAPAVLRRSPAGRASSPGTSMAATFSEAVVPASVTAPGAFTLVRKGRARAIRASVSYDPASMTATLDPRRRLTRGAVYVARLAPEVRDLAGNPLRGPVTWRIRIR